MHANDRNRPEGGAPALETSSTALRAGLALSDLDLDGLGRAVAAIGADLGREDVEAIVSGRRRATNHEHDVIAQALNDHFIERDMDHPVAYSDDLDPADGGGGEPDPER